MEKEINKITLNESQNDKMSKHQHEHGHDHHDDHDHKDHEGKTCCGDCQGGGACRSAKVMEVFENLLPKGEIEELDTKEVTK